MTFEDLGMVKKGKLYYLDSISKKGEWQFVAESDGNVLGGKNWKDDFDEAELDGVSIYQSKSIPTVATREYGDYGNAIICPKYYAGHTTEEGFIEKLQSKQKKVKLTEFPYGVVTINDLVVGQIIPFYPDSMTFEKAIREGKIKDLKMYKGAITILKELFDNGIMYYDLHNKNFLINNGSDMPVLIDFDDRYVKFRDEGSSLSSMLERIENFVNTSLYLMGYESDNYKSVKSFSSSMEQVDELNDKLAKKLIKKR